MKKFDVEQKNTLDSVITLPYSDIISVAVKHYNLGFVCLLHQLVCSIYYLE